MIGQHHGQIQTSCSTAVFPAVQLLVVFSAFNRLMYIPGSNQVFMTVVYFLAMLGRNKICDMDAFLKFS